MGEEKKEKVKEEEEPPHEIVLKVDMHCEACARKVARVLKGFEGVEEVSTDSKGGKVVVKGKAADPLKIYERVKRKSGRKVVLISPLPNAPQANNQENKDPPPKEELPAGVTVVLSIGMHCEACAQGLQKQLRKIEGVELVQTDLTNSQVIVKGMVDPTKLIEQVYKKTGKQASIVKEEEKKEEEKKEEVKKEEEKKQEEKKDGEEEKADIKRSEYWPSTSYLEYTCVPEMFSDDNPNACSIM